MGVTTRQACMLIDPAFLPLLEAFDLDALEALDDSVVGAFADGRIGYVNAGYVRFAEANGGGPEFMARWGVGAPMLRGVPERLAARYVHLIEEAMTRQSRVEHGYLCPSPTQHRAFRMRIYPLGAREGVLILHSLVGSGHHGVTEDPDNTRYRAANGLIVQCANCRHVRAVGDGERWDFVPDVRGAHPRAHEPRHLPWLHQRVSVAACVDRGASSR